VSITCIDRNNRGFTLAELLIAIVIFSLVVSMTYAAFNTTFRVIEDASSNSKYAERARITLSRITEDLESLYIGEKVIFEGKENFYGEMRGDSLSFTSRAHLIFHKDAEPAGYATISYSVEESADQEGLRLFRRDLAYLPGQQDEEEKGFLLCDGLQEVSFTYIDDNGAEQENWDAELRKENEEKEIPRAVQVKISFPDENKEGESMSVSTLIALLQTNASD
jgi:prepilin-type N-terminal cleavage/methylation domain-containing protein